MRYDEHMGRPKQGYPDLPPRMTGRTLRSGRILYYYQAGGRKIALGADLAQAKIRWAEYENGGSNLSSVQIAINRYRKEKLLQHARGTQTTYECYLRALEPAFGHLSFEQIDCPLVQEYIDRRSAKVAANREVSLLSAVWNFARTRGITRALNQCQGVEKNKERPRGRYVTEAEYRTVWEKATGWLQDAMDLAVLTGQRKGDILRMARQDVRDGCLWIVQAKTGAKLGVEIVGELAAVVERALGRPRRAQSVYLVADDRGQPITSDRFQRAFMALGADWRFNDLRAKAATDVPDIRHAQQLLGHRTEQTTGRVYRRVRGTVVKPSR